jgi:hypothetical protein
MARRFLLLAAEVGSVSLHLPVCHSYSGGWTRQPHYIFRDRKLGKMQVSNMSVYPFRERRMCLKFFWISPAIVARGNPVSCTKGPALRFTHAD